MRVLLLLLFFVLSLSFVSAQIPASCFLYVTAFNCVYKAQIGGTTFATNKEACLPITHSFTWASTIDPVNNVVYAMGGTSSRHLYAVSFPSGKVLSSPSVGNIYNAPYSLAADTRGNSRLYGLWQTSAGYTTVEVNSTTATIVQTYNTTNIYASGCFPFKNAFFDNTTNSYVTYWSCGSSVGIIQKVNVDIGAVEYIKYGMSSISDFGLHEATGRMFVLIELASGPIAVLYELISDGTVVQVGELQNVGSRFGLFNWIVMISNGICLYEPDDLNRNHPQPEDLVCSLFNSDGSGYSGFATLSTPNISTVSGSTSYVPYVSLSVPVNC